MINWRIYYEDGSAFDSDMGTPAEAPANGVIAINQVTGCGHHPLDTFKTSEKRLFGEDWYWWRADLDCWLQGERDGMLDQFMHSGAQYAKQGRMTSHKLWEELWIKIASDPDFRR